MADKVKMSFQEALTEVMTEKQGDSIGYTKSHKVQFTEDFSSAKGKVVAPKGAVHTVSELTYLAYKKIGIVKEVK